MVFTDTTLKNSGIVKVYMKVWCAKYAKESILFDCRKPFRAKHK